MKTLIIGFGSIGKRHAAILQDLSSVESIEIVTKQKDCPYSFYTSLESIPRIASYDYYVIASETALHLDQLNYIDKSVTNKKILVEKPLFHKSTDFSSKNNTIYVGYNLRFHPVILHLKEYINDKVIISVEVSTGQDLRTWRPGTDYRTSYSASISRGGGVLLDLSHEIDYTEWLFGSISDLNQSVINIAHDSMLEIETESEVRITKAKLKRGNYDIRFSLLLDYLRNPPQRLITITTKDETIIANLIDNTITMNGIERSFIYNRNDSYRKMHDSILNGDGKNSCTIDEALRTMRIIDDIKNHGGFNG